MGLIADGKLYEILSEDEHLILFYCPGCKCAHPYRLRGQGPQWIYNHKPDSPSFTPSLRVHYMGPNKQDCHLFLTEGEIRYCSDSWHDLAGKTIPLPLFQHYEGELDATMRPVIRFEVAG